MTTSVVEPSIFLAASGSKILSQELAPTPATGFGSSSDLKILLQLIEQPNLFKTDFIDNRRPDYSPVSLQL